jgi:hypothetical protein
VAEKTRKSMLNLMKTPASLLTGILLCTGTVIFAQYRDGTITPDKWVEEIKKNLNEEEKLLYNSASAYNTANLSIVAYIVNDFTGKANCNEIDINEGIDRLNQYFKTINVDFNLRAVQYVKDFNYGYIRSEGSTSELVKKHSADRTINLYLVESIKIDTSLCYGFTYYPSDTIRNYIFLNKYLLQGNYLITLMGHFFGLLSTHDTLGGFELVNEKNCDSAGDFLCDTWADPNLLLKVDTPTCVFKYELLDPNNEYYVPSVANLMSESVDRCKCIFTPHQYRRMLFCLKNYRYYLR